jgi:DNA replication protein DnaC
VNLSAAHYDAIMREYDNQRLENMHALNARIQGVYDRFPEIRQIDTQISDLAENFAESFTKEHVMSFEEYRRKLAELRMEKEALLKCYRIDPEMLQMQYRCPDCKDTGYIDNEKCHCLKQRIIDEMYQQSNLLEILKAENFSTLSYRYYDAENMEKMQIAIETCKNFAENFDKTFENILLCGTVGIGKTFLSNCIAKEVLDKGHSVLYLSAFQLFDLMAKNSFSGNAPKESSVAKQYPHIFESDLLIIDDLGTELANSFTMTGFFLVINERILRKKSTLISTNLSPEEILTTYTERCASRIISNYTMLKLSGSDIRLKKKLGGF